jgi:hypothetical protein
LNEGDTLFEKQPHMFAKGKKALCGSCEKIAAATGGVEHT